MSKASESKERVQRVLKGEEVDRPPASTWRHFFDRETTIDGEVESLIEFQNAYEWDFCKINLRAHYACEDWGFEALYSSDPLVPPWGPGTIKRTPIKHAKDWQKLERLNPAKGSFGAHLDVIRRLRNAFGPELPLLMTLFTPLGTAKRMVESEDILQGHMDERPDAVIAALEAITETLVDYVPLCLEAGADGLFYATVGWATYDQMTDEQYSKFGRPYDLPVICAAEDGWFNALHVCRSNIMLQALSDYPVHAFSWDAQDPGNPTLEEGLKITSKAVIGGIPPYEIIADLRPDEVKAITRDSLRRMDGKQFILGSGCDVPADTPPENIEALMRVVRARGKRVS